MAQSLFNGHSALLNFGSGQFLNPRDPTVHKHLVLTEPDLMSNKDEVFMLGTAA